MPPRKVSFRCPTVNSFNRELSNICYFTVAPPLHTWFLYWHDRSTIKPVQLYWSSQAIAQLLLVITLSSRLLTNRQLCAFSTPWSIFRASSGGWKANSLQVLQSVQNFEPFPTWHWKLVKLISRQYQCHWGSQSKRLGLTPLDDYKTWWKSGLHCGYDEAGWSTTAVYVQPSNKFFLHATNHAACITINLALSNVLNMPKLQQQSWQGSLTHTARRAYSPCSTTCLRSSTFGSTSHNYSSSRWIKFIRYAPSKFWLAFGCQTVHPCRQNRAE